MMEQKLDSLSKEELEKKLMLLERRIERERSARKEAEALLETKSLELYNANKSLESINKSLEKNIQVRTQTLVTLLNNLHAGVLLNDSSGKILFVNHEFLSVFQVSISSNDLIGRDQRESAELIKDLFADPDLFISILSKCRETNQELFNYELELKDERILDCDFIPIESDGDFIGHLWQVRDVTDRRVVQKKVFASEEKYRGIIENMELGLLEVDLDHKIVRAYNAFCEMTGYTEEELKGKSAVETFLPPDLKPQIDEQDEKRKRGEQSIYETRMIRKDGNEIWVLISGAPILNEDGVMTGSIGIHYDITRRKSLERQLREARNQAENAREAEKQFLANMSHEIRNPINAIIGMTNLLYDTQLSKDQIALLDKVKFSSDILMGLISGVLDISKIESGNFDLVEREIDLRDTLAAIVDIAGFKSAEKGLDIVLKLDPSLNFKVIADPTVINQIFLNLINNAIKFTEKGSVEVSGVVLEETESTAMFAFAVKDTGIGISKDKLAFIFDQFNQGDTETKIKYGGTGLGLAIVKRLVGGYHGEISVESTPGHGSIFQFTLQMAKAAHTGEENVVFTVKPKASHVLIVEDNPINQQYLSGILKNWSVTYDIANNGQEALTWVEEKEYDMILMDIRMPIMDGYETTIRIRANHANVNSKTFIIALTASALVDEKEKALAVGMNYHLTKPFTPRQLAYAFREFGLADTVEEKEKSALTEKYEGLDAEYLSEFYGEDTERLELMFEIFIDTIDSDVEDLVKAFKNEDWERFAGLAHKIKPNFAMVGLTELSVIMKHYELSRSSEDVKEEIRTSFEETIEKLERGKEVVKNKLNKIHHT